MNWKKIGTALLFPHIAVLLVLLPIAAAWLIYALLRLETASIPAIGAYVLAAYTFTTFTAAIVNLVRYRKYNSPVLSAGKAISLSAACVSILTLESTMLTTFATDTMTLTARKILLGCTGTAVSVFIIVMAVYMIVQSGRKLRKST